MYDHVVCGADELWVYYGAADSAICLAKAKLRDILDLVKQEPVA